MKTIVLLIDDEEAVTSALKRMLRDAPYEIHTANHLAAALDVLMKHPVDVVVCDEKMPGITGVDFLSKLRKDFPSTMRIMLTGVASVETCLRAINEGEVYRFLTKPCQQFEIRLAIEQAVQHKRLIDLSRRLLVVTRKQNLLLKKLESDHPGITSVCRSYTGAVLIEEGQATIDELLESLDRKTSNELADC